MGKAAKWIKSLLIGGGHGKKDKEKEKENNTSIVIVTNSTTPAVLIPQTPKDKKRWSFRRSSATKPATSPSPQPDHDHDDQKKEEKLKDTKITSPPPPDDDSAPEMDEKALKLLQEDAAAIKIQSVFRSYLARKALRALRGLVKIQALVRGHLVRKQATATLRCMHALVTAQARARAQRIRSAEENDLYAHHRLSSAQRMHNHGFNFTNSYQGMEPRMMMMMEENIKIVEMDQGQPKPTPKIIKTHYNQNYPPQTDHYYTPTQDYPKVSPSPSAMTDISPRTCSAHFEDYSYFTAQSSPQCYYSAVSRPDPSKTPFAQQDYPLDSYDQYPNYMANTQSSRAKARSQSAPKQRPAETTAYYERQLSKRRPSVEGRNIPRAVRMQRSSSQVGATAQNYQLPPWSVKLDKSVVSLRDSECGSTCSVLTNANYCRTVVSYDPQGNNYSVLASRECKERSCFRS